MAAAPPRPTPAPGNAGGPPLFRLVGARAAPFRDAYHAFLEASWPVAIGGISGLWILVNMAFATAYAAVGGVSGAVSWRDHFYFSVQTLSTVGYGAMVPQSEAAHLLVTLESLAGLVVTAVATGLVFAKFGRTTTHLIFARQAVIGTQDGVPTLAVRVGNERLNKIVDVRFAIQLIRTEHTVEGQTFYRMLDLPLTRTGAANLRAAFLLHHRIPGGPLEGLDPARFEADECELHVIVTGLDETTLQPVHASYTYGAGDVVWGARYVDMLTELPDGTIEVDVRKFHEVVNVTVAA